MSKSKVDRGPKLQGELGRAAVLEYKRAWVEGFGAHLRNGGKAIHWPHPHDGLSTTHKRAAQFLEKGDRLWYLKGADFDGAEEALFELFAKEGMEGTTAESAHLDESEVSFNPKSVVAGLRGQQQELKSALSKTSEGDPERAKLERDLEELGAEIAEAEKAMAEEANAGGSIPSEAGAKSATGSSTGLVHTMCADGKTPRDMRRHEPGNYFKALDALFDCETLAESAHILHAVTMPEPHGDEPLNVLQLASYFGAFQDANERLPTTGAVVADERKVEIFLNNIRPKFLKTVVNEAKPKSLDAAIKIAKDLVYQVRDIDASLGQHLKLVPKDIKVFKPDKSPRMYDKEDAGGEFDKDKKPGTHRTDAEEEQRRIDFAAGACLICHKKGHRAVECPETNMGIRVIRKAEDDASDDESDEHSSTGSEFDEFDMIQPGRINMIRRVLEKGTTMAKAASQPPEGPLTGPTAVLEEGTTTTTAASQPPNGSSTGPDTVFKESATMTTAASQPPEDPSTGPDTTTAASRPPEDPSTGPTAMLKEGALAQRVLNPNATV